MLGLKLIHVSKRCPRPYLNTMEVKKYGRHFWMEFTNVLPSNESLRASKTSLKFVHQFPFIFHRRYRKQRYGETGQIRMWHSITHQVAIILKKTGNLRHDGYWLCNLHPRSNATQLRTELATIPKLWSCACMDVTRSVDIRDTDRVFGISASSLPKNAHSHSVILRSRIIRQTTWSPVSGLVHLFNIMTLYINLVNIESGNGLLPDDTKSLPEPMLTYTIDWFLWHLPMSSFMGSIHGVNIQNEFENPTFKTTAKSSMGQWA